MKIIYIVLIVFSLLSSQSINEQIQSLENLTPQKGVELMNHTKIADILVSNIPDNEVGVVQTQSHPKYHFSKDGKYFYMFLC